MKTHCSREHSIPTSPSQAHGERVLLFPGSFDPFTVGHASLVERALRFFDEIVIAIGVNEQKPGWIPVSQRVDALRRYCEKRYIYNNVSRVRVECYTGLTTDYAAAVGATAILRGVRSIKDYEYELQMADVNRSLTGIETIVLFTEPQYAAVSSSIVRELAHFGHDISSFLPEGYDPLRSPA